MTLSLFSLSLWSIIFLMSISGTGISTYHYNKYSLYACNFSQAVETCSISFSHPLKKTKMVHRPRWTNLFRSPRISQQFFSFPACNWKVSAWDHLKIFNDNRKQWVKYEFMKYNMTRIGFNSVWQPHVSTWGSCDDRVMITWCAIWSFECNLGYFIPYHPLITT